MPFQAQIALPTTWQFAVFPYAKETQEGVKASNKSYLSFNLALMESMNPLWFNLYYSFIHSHHHFPTNLRAPLSPI